MQMCWTDANVVIDDIGTVVPTAALMQPLDAGQTHFNGGAGSPLPAAEPRHAHPLRYNPHSWSHLCAMLPSVMCGRMVYVCVVCNTWEFFW
jgi:hypothetical protein